MSSSVEKPVLTPPEPAPGADFSPPEEHLLCTQGVRGSNPLVSTKIAGPHAGSAFHFLEPLLVRSLMDLWRRGRESQPASCHESPVSSLV